ncbi:MAG: hypothetical protein H0W48_03860 [Methylibium sp.]|nr:hypothetical protein [Methylibium sp.]MBA3623585.1 hypothetical protein [Methylibium sp.]
MSIIGSSDSVKVENWYSAARYRTEEFHTADGQMLLESQVQNLVDAMASFALPAAGQTALPADYRTALAPTLAANWQPAG